MKTVKTKIGVIALGFILGLALGINPVYAFDFDKEEMDMALREELQKVDDIDVRQAMLDEYKEVLLENMPELDIEEATCHECEEDLREDLRELEKEQFSVATLNNEEFKNEREITESQSDNSTEPESEPEPEPKKPCACERW